MQPPLYVCHGGGPWPWMEGGLRAAHAGLEEALRALPSRHAPAPRAVLVATAHWESDAFALSAHPRPPMLHDYAGFPPHTYRVSYPAPGEPALAERARRLLAAAGLAARLDAERGFDHGTFVPLHLMYPGARVPVVQLSLRADLDPSAHLAAGRALAPLCAEGVLLLGSGSSYHNLRARGPLAARESAEFDAWLQHAVCGLAGAAREDALAGWTGAPSARAAHPREEHLLPLLVAAGAAGTAAGHCSWRQTDGFGFATLSNFAFGPAAG